jgi:sugar O-acyltransferase (sialic acid O-acetyltransferase NeuD family)
MGRSELILFGAGGHARSCIDVIELENKYSIVGLVGLPSEVGKSYFGYKVINNDEATAMLARKYCNALVSIGQISSPNLKIRLFNEARAAGFHFPVCQSPRAQVSKHALIGHGTIIMHGAVINAGASIGENCIINTHAIIEHDAVIGDHCHISTGAIVNGGVRVGRGSFIGSGAVVRESLFIADGAFVKMGSHVSKYPSE